MTALPVVPPGPVLNFAGHCSRSMPAAPTSLPTATTTTP
jgi:hypothetical protein